jgi:hypothetical protein
VPEADVIACEHPSDLKRLGVVSEVCDYREREEAIREVPRGEAQALDVDGDRACGAKAAEVNPGGENLPVV